MKAAFGRINHLLKEEFQNLESTKGRVTANCLFLLDFRKSVYFAQLITEAYQIPHYLTCNISPSNENTARTHRSPLLLSSKVCTVVTHEPLATLVGPAHNFTNRLTRFAEAFQKADKFYFEQLHKVFVTAVANKGRLISDRFEINFLPRSAHLSQLFGIRKDSVECLCNLINVKEAH
jgi:hypothetical protein